MNAITRPDDIDITVQSPHPSPPPQGGRESYETTACLTPPPLRERGLGGGGKCLRPDIDQLLKDSRQMDAMLRRAVIQAIQMHKRAGNPIAVWREGKVVWLSPEEIPDAPDESP